LWEAVNKTQRASWIKKSIRYVSEVDYKCSTNFDDKPDAKVTERKSGSTEYAVAVQGPDVDLLTDFARYGGRKHSGRVFTNKEGNIRDVASPIVVTFTSTPAEAVGAPANVSQLCMV